MPVSDRLGALGGRSVAMVILRELSARATAALVRGRGMGSAGAEPKNDTKQEDKMPSDQIP